MHRQDDTHVPADAEVNKKVSWAGIIHVDRIAHNCLGKLVYADLSST